MSAQPSPAPSTTVSGPAGPRLYGGWRRTRGIGLWGLGAASTAVVLGCLLLPMLLAAASLQAGLTAAAPALLVAAGTVARVDGTPLLPLLAHRLRWASRSAGGRRARTRPAPGLGSASSPARSGPLAGLEVLEVPDARGGFALVRDVASGSLTATLRCAAASTWLVDRDAADGWVSGWHSWLAGLGYLPAVRWVAVSVDTAPEPGTRLRREVLSRLDPRAPADARELLRELVDRSPRAAADVRTSVSVTFCPAGAGSPGGTGRRPSGGGRRRAAPGEQAEEVARLLPGLEAGLASCGVTVLGRMGADEVTRVVRRAYDPAARTRAGRSWGWSGQPFEDWGEGWAEDWTTDRTVDRAADWPRRSGDGGEAGWPDAGPVAVEEGWDRYRHDSGTSVSWGWREAPRQHVTSDVLARLVGPGRHARRVTLLYRALPAADAARTLEAQVNAAAFRDAYRRAQRRDETARDVADRELARRAAQEEAMGAGVVLMSLFVTTTVTDERQLDDAVADVEARADQSKVRLRRLYGGQSAGFLATLPLGVHPLVARRRTRRRDVR